MAYGNLRTSSFWLHIKIYCGFIAFCCTVGIVVICQPKAFTYLYTSLEAGKWRS